jgi:hypothetical protein
MIQQLKAYKNEILIGLALLLLLVSLVYKQGKVSATNGEGGGATSSLQELKEVIALKKVWGDKKITKKVDKLKNILSPSKIKWSRKGKKLTASFKNISAQELNRLVVKIMNLAVEIQKLEVHKSGTSYQVELKCKW